jgi:DNA helicase II / ATP-dependent DNA helicase PcrA
MRSVKASDWQPVGVKNLEPAADEAVRASTNTLVVAGPGAGKTELLAQRACFLLQTGICVRPHRILAISFKRDAARNLGERVRLRCADDLAARFDSFTFDSFAKRLVDHFGCGLPKPWIPTKDYELRLKELNWKPSGRIADEPRANTALWKKFVEDKNPSWMNFPMLSVLAEHILVLNPFVLNALRRTYSHVFLDEFQDTTDLQYQLTKTGFVGSRAVVTAVGDPKQRIMQWAGALAGIFQQFKSDFGASVLRPSLNYRSAPELIRIQGILAAALEKRTVVAVPSEGAMAEEGECRILSFENSSEEARFLASFVKNWVDSDQLSPRDVCVLTRNRPPDYTSELQEELRKCGIKARIESEIQDLLSEPLTSMLLDFLRLAAAPRAPSAWTNTLNVLRNTMGGDSEQSQREIERRLSVFLKKLRSLLKKTGGKESEIHKVLEAIILFVGDDHFKALHPQYVQGELYQDTFRQIGSYLSRFRATMDWNDALDEFEGIDAVPIMTIHKSKGLEYHTVVFVGFEDSAFWGFQRNPTEETCTFFVAFSRAKKRVAFTFCEHREKPAGTPPQSQERTTIGPLYELLRNAGILPEPIRD